MKTEPSPSVPKTAIANRRSFLALPYALLGFFTLLRTLEVAGTIYFQTIYRSTVPTKFHLFLTGSFITDDLLVVAIGIVAALVFFYNRKVVTIILYPIIGFYIVVMALAFSLNSSAISTTLALSVFPSLTIIFLAIKEKFSFPSRITKNSLVLMTIYIFLSIEIVSFFTWVLYPAFPSKIYGEWFWYGADLEAKLFYTFGLLSPALMVLTIFSFGIKPGVESFKELFRKWSKVDVTTQIHTASAFVVTRRTTIIVLSISSVAASLLSLYPYLPSINPNFQVLSVDAPFYVNQIETIMHGGLFSEGGPFSFANERLLSILVFYAIVSVTGQPPAYVVPLLPIMLNLLLIFSVYFLLRHVRGKNDIATLLVPILTVFSTQFVVGIYGGFFSNMLALPLLAISFLFFLRYYDQRRKLDVALFTAAMFATLLVHVYTWVFLTGSIIVTVVIDFIVNRNQTRLRTVIPILVAVVATASILLGVALFAKGNSGANFLSNLATSSISENYFATRWFNLNYVFRVYLGGFLTNSALILLALIWVLKASYRNRFDILIMSSIFISSVFFFIGDSVVQSRMFYNILLQIPAGIVLANIFTGNMLRSVAPTTRFLLISLVIMHLANYALRSLANFYLVVNN